MREQNKSRTGVMMAAVGVFAAGAGFGGAKLDDAIQQVRDHRIAIQTGGEMLGKEATSISMSMGASDLTQLASTMTGQMSTLAKIARPGDASLLAAPLGKVADALGTSNSAFNDASRSVASQAAQDLQVAIGQKPAGLIARVATTFAYNR